jgi:hypothetical protein
MPRRESPRQSGALVALASGQAGDLYRHQIGQDQRPRLARQVEVLVGERC